LSWVPATPAQDLEYAIRAGVMFPPRAMPHNQALRQLCELRSQIAPRQVGDAFASTLSSASPALRSALGSYAVALHMPPHRYSARFRHHRCRVCGGSDSRHEVDLNVLSFERHKWGGVRHEDPLYIVFDLERFAVEADPQSTRPDHDALIAVLRCCESTAVGAKPADLVSGIKHIVPGNSYQRRTVIAVLGFAGILRVPQRPGFVRSFTPAGDREDTPWYKDDWPYPARWWRGGTGIDPEAVAFWFGLTWPAV
jgi:hypothetical protein